MQRASVAISETTSDVSVSLFLFGFSLCMMFICLRDGVNLDCFLLCTSVKYAQVVCTQAMCLSGGQEESTLGSK